MNEIKKIAATKFFLLHFDISFFDGAPIAKIENCNTITEAYDYSKTIYLFIYYFFIFSFTILGARKVNGIYIERQINRNKW